jgi:hypothetical protein
MARNNRRKNSHALTHRSQRATTSTCQNTRTYPCQSAHQHAHRHIQEHTTHEQNPTEGRHDNKHNDAANHTKKPTSNTHKIPTVCSQLGTACSSNDAGDGPETTGKRGKRKQSSCTRGDELFAPLPHRWAKCNESQTPLTGETLLTPCIRQASNTPTRHTHMNTERASHDLHTTRQPQIHTQTQTKLTLANYYLERTLHTHEPHTHTHTPLQCPTPLCVNVNAKVQCIHGQLAH